MELTEIKIERSESPFLFDVWRCEICGYVITREQRALASIDYPCPCCYLTALSDFALWPGQAAYN